MAQRRRRRRRRRRRGLNLLPLLIALACMTAIVCLAMYLFRKASVNDNVMDGMTYYGLASEEEAAIVVDDRILELKGIIRDGEVYIPYGAVWNTLNSSYYWESSTEQLLLTLPSGTSMWSVGDGTGVLLRENGKLYVKASNIQENSDIDMQILQNPTRVVARTKWNNLAAEEVLEDTPVRYWGGPKSEVLTYLKKGDIVVLTENTPDWCKVSTPDGYLGYVKKDVLAEAPQGAISHTTEEKFRYEKISLDHPVVMAWHYIGSTDNNSELQMLTEHASSLNTIAPTWFSYADMEGNITSMADKAYVDQAHAAGIQVWGTLTDVSGGELSSGTILQTHEVRTHVISQLMDEAEKTGMDGINVDIETITEDEVPQYLQFLRELCVTAHKKGLIISTDNYVPLYTGYYNRKEQAKMVDYLVIMGYDEHTAGSAEAGSVASLPSVEQGIRDTLSEVPASQVINAVPFYTRGWTSWFGEERPESEAFGMDGADEFVKLLEIYLSWDSSVGQKTGTVVTDEARYSIWLEDEQSLEEKLKLIRKYNLAGVAAWRLGFERNDVWEIIGTYMN